MSRAALLVGVLLVSLLLGMNLCNDMRHRDTFESSISWIASNSNDSGSDNSRTPKSGRPMSWSPECVHVPIVATPRDSMKEKEIMCRNACSSPRAGDLNIPRGVVVSGETVACKCCDPAARVVLDEQAEGTENCVQNVTYGVGARGSRSMFVSDGCKGIFRWGNGKLVRCEHNPNETVTMCPYFDSAMPVGDVARYQDQLQSFYADGKQQKEAEKAAARKRELDAMLKASKTATGAINPLKAKFG